MHSTSNYELRNQQAVIPQQLDVSGLRAIDVKYLVVSVADCFFSLCETGSQLFSARLQAPHSLHLLVATCLLPATAHMIQLSKSTESNQETESIFVVVNPLSDKNVLL